MELRMQASLARVSQWLDRAEDCPPPLPPQGHLPCGGKECTPCPLPAPPPALLRLPQELLHLILSLLPFPDLKHAALTCRQLQAAATHPALWAAFTPVLSPTNLHHLAELLAVPRLARSGSLRVQGCRLQARHVASLLRSSVTSITLGEAHNLAKDVEVAAVPSTLLASLATKVSELRLHSSLLHQLSELQVLTLTNQMDHPTSKLRKLEIFYDNQLSSLPRYTLARAFASLTHLSLVFQRLGPDHYNSLLAEVAGGRSNLTALRLPGNPLAKVDPKLLAGAVATLTRANLSDTRLSALHLHTLLANLDSGTKLRHLDISHNGSMRQVGVEVMARLARVSDVDLKFCRLTRQQVAALLKAVVAPTSSLSTMSLVGNSTVGAQEATLLATAVHHLASCNLYATNLSLGHITAILTHHHTSNLNTLDLGGNNLSGLDPETWQPLLSRLSHLSLYHCHLPLHHQLAMLASLTSTSRLLTLDLGGNEEGVTMEVIRAAEDGRRRVIANQL